MLTIEETIQVVKRTQAEARAAKADFARINAVAKKQRVEIRRLKRLLEQVLALVPPTVRADKLFEEIDGAIYKEEL